MYTYVNQQFSVYVLSLALLLVIGIYLETSYDHNAEIPSSVTLTKANFEKPLRAVLDLSIPGTPMNPVQTSVKEHSEEPASTITNTTATKYETTAYYLNVRAGSTRTSKILHTVKKGTVLEVLYTTENGWLKLRTEGYVHGGYAKLIGETPKPAEPVTPAADSAEGQPLAPTSKVVSDSGLTEVHIGEIIKGTALEGQALEKTILEIEKKYGINAYFTIAIMKLESGNGKSRIARSKNNLFGLNAIDGDQYNQALKFETKGDSVRKFGQLIADNYVDKGYTTVEKVASKYCPANPKWSALVKNIMKRDYSKSGLTIAGRVQDKPRYVGSHSMASPSFRM
jgi:energy-converting hydrogenase Eha subunit F